MENKFKSNQFIKRLNELRKEDVGFAGGKGANLGELMKIKLPVPRGFCVSTFVYKYFLRRTALDQKIRAVLPTLATYEPKKLENGMKKIRQLIESEPLPDELRKQISVACQKLREMEKEEQLYIAVRSSATIEDQPNTSFAGQFKTRFDTYNERKIIEMIKSCWTSLFSPSVLAYMKNRGLEISIEKQAMAVIVQRMINSDVAGVIFTEDPVWGDQGVMIIEACWGLGESIVSGSVSPDRYVIDKKNLRVAGRTLGSKKTLLQMTPRGIVRRNTPKGKREIYCLEEIEVKFLGKMAKIIERHYNTPQDIEWALKKDNLTIHILQSRPITVL